MGLKSNLVGWFEIPVTDMGRAKAFYDHVFQIDIQIHHMGELEMGWFPSSEDASGASGSLVAQPDFYVPSDSKGVLVYFTCEDVAKTLERAVAAGGTVLQEKKEIGGGYGFMGLLRDVEGNRIALHSRS